MSDERATVHLQAGPLSMPAVEAVERDDLPFDLLIIGDFSGWGSRGELRASLAGVRPIPVDRDDFDSVLAGIAPRIRVMLEGTSSPMDLEFTELDDYLPDELFSRAPLFATLRNLRRRALDPGELRKVAAELGTPPGQPAPAPGGDIAGGAADAGGAAAGGSRYDSSGSGGSVLDQILEQAQPDPGLAPSLAEITGHGLDDVVRRLVRPHLVPGPDPRQAEVLGSIDAAVGDAMRRLLHAPAFQESEALWRALFLLVRHVETGADLHIRILDVGRAELAAELAAGAPGGLVPSGGAPAPPSLIVAAYTFGSSSEDLAILRGLAGLGERLQAPCVTAGSPALVGARDVQALTEPAGWGDPPEAWEALRSLPAARFLGIALPRFLLRLPYGADAKPVERIDFEELAPLPTHEHYLWGNPAIACAALLAQSFADSGWEMRPGATRDLDGLPHHVRHLDGEGEALPAAEVWLTEDAAERMLDAGVMPLASLRDRNAARVVRFQSVAAPLTPLAGRWTSA